MAVNNLANKVEAAELNMHGYTCKTIQSWQLYGNESVVSIAKDQMTIFKVMYDRVSANQIADG